MLILSVLAGGPAHGYGIVEHLRNQSGGALDLAEGTVYPALYRMEADGLLASAWSTGAGRRKRVYSLTARGRSALRAREREWTAFVAVVQSVLQGAPWPTTA